MSTNKSLDSIKSNDLFKNVDFNTLNFPFDTKNFSAFKEDELIYSAGQNSDSIFLIVSGEIKIKLNSVKRLLFKSVSEFFGEIEILQDEDRTSSALADCDCILYQITSEVLENLCESSSNLKENLSSGSLPKSENNISIKEIEELATVNSDIVLNADTRKFDLNEAFNEKSNNHTTIDIDDIKINRFEEPPDLDDFIQEKYRKNDNKSLKTQMIDDPSDMTNWVITEQIIDINPPKIEVASKNSSTTQTNIERTVNSVDKLDELQPLLDEKQDFDFKPYLNQFSNFIMQDVKTPLITVKHYSSMLSRFDLPEEVKKVINSLTGQTNSILDLLQASIDFSHNSIKNKLETVNFDDVANQSLTSLSEYVESRNVKLYKKLSCVANVKIDKRKFYVSCYYILRFSCDVMKQGGNIYCSSNIAGSDAVLTFKDDNKFIKQSHLKEIFDPGFTNGNGEIIGLSLAISKFILESVGGSISIQISDSGTSYLVSIPILI